MEADPSNDELRKFIESMLSNLDRQLREPGVIDEAIREHREMWLLLYRASCETDRRSGERDRARSPNP